MKGKEKCRILKEIRREIADKNDINLVVSECTHQGECKGTCPKCEAEVRKLEQELEKKRKLGKSVAIVGTAAALLAGTVGCSVGDVVTEVTDWVDSINAERLEGDVMVETLGSVAIDDPSTDGCEQYDEMEP